MRVLSRRRKLNWIKLEYYHERRLKELGLVGKEGETYCQPKKDSIPTL